MTGIDFFLKIDGIPGESHDFRHKEEIQLDTYSWGESQTGSMHFDSGGGAGKVRMRDFTCVFKTCKASPKLYIACASGRHIKEATVSCRKAGASGMDFFQFKFKDLLVSSYSTAGVSPRPHSARPDHTELLRDRDPLQGAGRGRRACGRDPIRMGPEEELGSVAEDRRPWLL